MIPLSVLDLSLIIQGGDAASALRNTLDLARHAERLGFNRYWVAEHHNMPGIAGAATAVVIGHVAGGTSSIRVGSGGIMLPNHSPLVIAEQFGTLASLYPGRIDLGLGRAPGTDMRTAQALRRNMSGADTFPQDVLELQSYFLPAAPDQAVRAVPGAGLDVPLWLLGSSLFSAQLAAALGLPFAFASHFAPDALTEALYLYRSRFRPSAQLSKPYAMLGVSIYAADTDAEAARLFTSAQQGFVQLRRGNPGPVRPPVDSMDGLWSEMEKANVERTLAYSIVGSPETVKRGLMNFIERTGADELIVGSQIFDHAARVHSYEILGEILAELRQEIAAEEDIPQAASA
jgi:luciferase family oxidoreductase group 1